MGREMDKEAQQVKVQDQQLTAKMVPWSTGRREKAVPSIEEKERRCKGERRAGMGSRECS